MAMSMSFAESCYRQVTPPAGPDYFFADDSTESCDASPYWASNDVSPNSVDTRCTTPPRSPARAYGPLLLPRIRTQDVDGSPVTTVVAPSQKHRKSRSTSTGPTAGYVASVANPALFRRSLSPAFGFCPTETSYVPPRAASVPRASSYATALLAPSIHSRSTSVSSVHSRSNSIQSIEAAQRYAGTQYGTQGQSNARRSSLATVMRHATLPAAPAAPVQPAAPQQQPLAPELLFDNYAEMPESTTLLDFLTAPNPTTSLVRKLVQPNRLHDTHFWWDVRNIRTWTDFSLETIFAIPGLSSLLNHEIPDPALPKPAKISAAPETVSQLHDGYAAFYATKVNAALKVALGSTYPVMTSNKAAATQANPRGAPADFTAHHASDYDRTAFGDPKARVVGLVRAFDQWNSGMRAGETTTASTKVEYLRELACLHRHMREHGCRYGFILTEIELVCVRAGTDALPYYGYLELAPPVRLSAHGPGVMTAPLALWYLHMLAKPTPLAGQPAWRIEVGGPAALTRQHCLERDCLALKPEGREKRDAKRNRGWILPEDPLSRKECGRTKKWNRG